MSKYTLPSRSHGGPAEPVAIRFELTPYRSLSRTGFLILMGCVGLVSFIAGTAFAMIGAWPVFGFFCIDVALIWLAFQLNYRSGRQLETIEINDGRLTLTHVDVRGQSRRTELPAAWIDVRFTDAVDGRTFIALASHGRVHPFGGFLTDDERRELAFALRAVLLEARGGARI
jgi:uncharacterized membrane protein